MLDQLRNIMTTIALGLAVVAFADHWLEGKAEKHFLSFGVVA